ncbi:MAG TPA: orotate phosphoribosyltransferase [Polyangiaceae bacterium]|jgi:orotate phosphoribosyltransferase|nr:orotate phosphoribosyltransferase [Polyangiaceae bacterium]
MLPAYKQSFIEFMVRSNVLTFGDFVTKSGRATPFFINTGRYRTGAQLAELGRYYAEAITARGVAFDFLFGPAYKGIPLVVSVAMTLAARGNDVPFCFNRKEAKDHGEGGNLIGHQPQNGERVLFVEDVTTAGTSIRETVPLLQKAATVIPSGLVVSVDRMERGLGDKNALDELSEQFQMPTFAIVTVEEVMAHLRGREVDGRVVLDETLHAKMRAYREQYGAR